MSPGRALNPASRAVLLAFLLLAAGLVFQQIATLMIAVLITVLLAIPLEALTSRLHGRRVPRAIGALVGVLIGIAFLAGVLAVVIPPLVSQTQELIDQVPDIVSSIQAQIEGGSGSSEAAAADIQSFLQGLLDDPGQLAGPVASIGVGIASVLGALLLIVVTAYYMAIRPEPLTSGVLSLVPPDRRAWAGEVMTRLRRAWIGWMQGVLVDMLLTGILIFGGLSLIGLDFAILFAVLSAVLVIVPYFGAIVGAIPPIAFALADSPEKALLTGAIYIAVQQIESNVTIPLVMAQRVKLHPAVVAIGVVIVGQLFGFIGLFVAVPILSAAVIMIDELWVKRIQLESGVATAEGAGAGSLAIATAADVRGAREMPLRGEDEPPEPPVPPSTTPARSSQVG
ncbi:MAG: AI-2E family transporter [Solirubrobacterales bacterium]|nr:AI-2E family transporter [Solirubrobacterales bacterium]